MKYARILTLVCLSLLALPAFAAPGDDEAVIRHCGHPLDDRRAVSQVTNQWQRDMYFPNDVVFHFQPVDGGWDLTSAWVKHLPETRTGLMNKFPCVKEALMESAAAGTSGVRDMDPTIAAQTTVPRVGGTFGIPHLWLILLLAATLLLVILLPSATRRRSRTAGLPEPRNLTRTPDYERHSSSSIRKVE